MKQKLSRLMIVTIVLLLTMLLLTACGDGGAEVGETDPGFVYLPEYIGLPEDVDNIEGMTYQNEQLYFYFTGVIGNKEPKSPLKPGDAEYYDGMYDVYGPSLCKINLDGTGFEKLSAFVPLAMPDGMSGNTNINSICFDKDGNLWVAESGYMNHTTEAGEWVDD
ncbi:MAG: two-component regulator propeller domain-containing protein, partial [Clostridiales bacterium]